MYVSFGHDFPYCSSIFFFLSMLFGEMLLLCVYSGVNAPSNVKNLTYAVLATLELIFLHFVNLVY